MISITKAVPKFFLCAFPSLVIKSAARCLIDVIPPPLWTASPTPAFNPLFLYVLSNVHIWCGLRFGFAMWAVFLEVIKLHFGSTFKHTHLRRRISKNMCPKEGVAISTL